MVADLGPKNGQLLVGARVHHPADAFDLFGDLARGWPTFGAFEEHVLEKMRHACNLVALVARARTDEDVDADRSGVRK